MLASLLEYSNFSTQLPIPHRIRKQTDSSCGESYVRVNDVIIYYPLHPAVLLARKHNSHLTGTPFLSLTRSHAYTCITNNVHTNTDRKRKIKGVIWVLFRLSVSLSCVREGCWQQRKHLFLSSLSPVTEGIILFSHILYTWSVSPSILRHVRLSRSACYRHNFKPHYWYDVFFDKTAHHCVLGSIMACNSLNS